MAVNDINGDGLDDVIIGAPMHTDFSQVVITIIIFEITIISISVIIFIIIIIIVTIIVVIIIIFSVITIIVILIFNSDGREL